MSLLLEIPVREWFTCEYYTHIEYLWVVEYMYVLSLVCHWLYIIKWKYGLPLFGSKEFLLSFGSTNLKSVISTMGIVSGLPSIHTIQMSARRELPQCRCHYPQCSALSSLYYSLLKQRERWACVAYCSTLIVHRNTQLPTKNKRRMSQANVVYL